MLCYIDLIGSLQLFICLHHDFNTLSSGSDHWQCSNKIWYPPSDMALECVGELQNLLEMLFGDGVIIDNASQPLPASFWVTLVVVS